MCLSFFNYQLVNISCICFLSISLCRQFYPPQEFSSRRSIVSSWLHDSYSRLSVLYLYCWLYLYLYFPSSFISSEHCFHLLAAKLFWPDVFVHICVYICIWISVILYSYLYLYLPSSFISTEHCLHQVGQWKIFGRQLRRGNWGRRMPSRASATLQQLAAKTNSWHDKYCWSTRHTCEQKQEYSSNKLCEKHAEFSVLLKTMTKQADLSN